MRGPICWSFSRSRDHLCRVIPTHPDSAHGGGDRVRLRLAGRSEDRDNDHPTPPVAAACVPTRRGDPVGEVEQLHDQMDQLIWNLFRDPFAGLTCGLALVWIPAADIQETDDSCVVSFRAASGPVQPSPTRPAWTGRRSCESPRHWPKPSCCSRQEPGSSRRSTRSSPADSMIP
jgi:hypothetical protein